MKPAAQVILLNAARLHAPLVMLFAFTLLSARAAGSGVGFLAGAAFALALLLHNLVFGASAARVAFPTLWARGLLSIGVIAAVVSAGMPELRYAAAIGEAGLFVAIASGAHLVLLVLFGRAPTLRDAEW